jgi:hypothetical protein
VPHWRRVTPFALTSSSQFRPPAPARYGTRAYWAQAAEIVFRSATLNDRSKAIAVYWADGPSTETPPGHWMLVAQAVSARDRHTLDDDVKMFFALGNALLDASIAAWDCKVLSRRLGGIHFRDGDLQGRAMGQRIGEQVWDMAVRYFDGSRKTRKAERN